MELQCKERVDVLEALRQSRIDSTGTSTPPRNSATTRGRTSLPKMPRESSEQSVQGWSGQKTIPATKYPDLSKPGPPPLPERPIIYKTKSTDIQTQRSHSVPQALPFEISSYHSPINSTPLTKHTSRTPSPEKKSRLLTTLRPGKDGKRPSKSPRGLSSRRSDAPVASKAAGLAWDSIGRSGQRLGQSLANHGESTTILDPMRRESAGGGFASRPASAARTENETAPSGNARLVRQPSPPDLLGLQDHRRPNSYPVGHLERHLPSSQVAHDDKRHHADLLVDLDSAVPPPYDYKEKATTTAESKPRSPNRPTPLTDYPSYRKEYQPLPPSSKMVAQLSSRPVGPNQSASASSVPTRQRSPQRKTLPLTSNGAGRRQAEKDSSSHGAAADKSGKISPGFSDSADEYINSFRGASVGSGKAPNKAQEAPLAAQTITPSSRDLASPGGPPASRAWAERLAHIKKHLPKGVDENAAKQIFNEIVVQGDEVHWDDVAGLDIAKNALKEAVVYPFLRPDLFMGLREPARGMLLFGPPGTGKTMLARAVATESRSTFFAISASSLTSKYLGESEKLVRALFSLAKALAPSIIFVDEIDSLLSSRGGSSEHEATRRIKTEFLIQWSDLQRAAAGKVQTDKEKQEGDASRVLVLAATNLPWAIDEAARRRFVRRQYIPLPEGLVRATQLKTLLGHQKHNLNKQDIQVLVELTDGTTIQNSSSAKFLLIIF